MSDKMKNNTIWALRILVSGLFLLSAYSKLFPVNSALFVFEKQIVDLGITNWCFAPLLARAIVAFEVFLGLAILQNHLLKNIILPATFFLLLAFCIHLSITIYNTGNNGSCGCFGELIPMKPLEAIFKNIITMGMLVFIFLKTKRKGKDRIEFPFAIFVAVYLSIFMFFQPKCCCSSQTQEQVFFTDSTTTASDTVVAVVDDSTSVAVVETTDNEQPNIKSVVEKPGRKKVNSVFTKYTKFNVGTVDLNAGKKIVCLFSLDCDHCEAASKQLQFLKQSHPDLPGVYVLAFGEEDQVSGFFTAGGGRFPYQIIPPEEFFPLLDKASYPPRIVVMDNGNFLGDFINFEQLDTAAVMQAVRK
ncbi:MAG: hypothetical protein CVU11_08100 [Bacteroidetes bacterium HGW-Bacteroidetes-6]|jgi:hypothetical protein|nr:MAG: hypothetical protein CVU11_08100 [Bacteroidetes bacterium HGW-Bacteroidetes-6]